MTNPPRFEGLAENKITWYSNPEPVRVLAKRFGRRSNYMVLKRNPDIIPDLGGGENYRVLNNRQWPTLLGLEGNRIIWYSNCRITNYRSRKDLKI